MTAGRPGAAVDVAALAVRAGEALERAGAGGAGVGLILGSGMSFLADEVDDPVVVPYAGIPDFPRSTVAGHPGNFVVGRLDGAEVAIAQGRFHLYEGYTPAAVALPVRVVRDRGARALIVTNAAGSLDPRLRPGTPMAIRDHVNLQFGNPLRGRPPETISNPFPDMSSPYDRDLTARLHAVALAERIRLAEGVYAGVLGPSYETAAEIRFLRRAGADAVGMSTVGEAIAAAEIGLPVVGISLITNLATGLARAPLSHDDVQATVTASRDRLRRLVRGLLGDLVASGPAD